MGEDTFSDDDFVDLDESVERAEADHRRRTRRQPLELPKAHTFAEAVAACALVRALRPFHGWTERETPILLGIVAHEDWISTFRDVLERFLSGGKTYGVNAQVSAWSEPPRAIRNNRRDIMRTMRAFAVVSNADFLPQGFALAADGVVSVGDVDLRHVHAAAHHFLGIHISDDDASVIAGASLESMLSLRKGRSLRDALRRLRATLVEPEAVKPSAAAPTLDDLHGLGEAGEWGRDLAADLADWKAGKIDWPDVDRGILLSGPPGTGKTTFASALARTCGVDLVTGSIARWQSRGHMGDMLKAMYGAFNEAKAKAPAILFVDEVDAIGDRETFTGEHVQYCTEVVNGFLECLDGIDGREGVVVVGACNHPDKLDAAIKRPGRLDRHVVIPLPDTAGREGILRWHLAGSLVSTDLSGIAARTEGWSGAALEQIVRQARRLARRGRRNMTLDDLVAALPTLVPLPPDVVWRSCVHEAGHAVVGETLGRWRVAHARVTREYSPDVALQDGGGVQFENGPLVQNTAESYRDWIVRALGGTAAEQVLLGERADGAGGSDTSDLASATRYAAILEGSVGLGEGLAYLGEIDGDVEHLVRRDYVLRKRIDGILAECLERAVILIQERRGDVERLAAELRDRGSLSGDEVREVIDAQTRLALVQS